MTEQKRRIDLGLTIEPLHRNRRVRRGWFYKLQADIERIRKTSNL